MSEWLLRLIRFLRRPFDRICHVDDTDGFGRLGYVFAWFASGTDCRCCIGMRIPFAFVIGLTVGLLL